MAKFPVVSQKLKKELLNRLIHQAPEEKIIILTEKKPLKEKQKSETPRKRNYKILIAWFLEIMVIESWLHTGRIMLQQN